MNNVNLMMIAWCNEETSTDYLDFECMAMAGIMGVVVDLAGDMDRALKQLSSAHCFELPINVAYTSDLSDPTADGTEFGRRIQRFNLPKSTRACLTLPPSMGQVEDIWERVEQFYLALASTGATTHADLCVSPATWEYNPALESLAWSCNLVSWAPNCAGPQIMESCTWVSRDHVGKDTQYLAVDKLGCYANPGETNGYQLSFDNEYLVQEGDTWRTIAAQHGLDPAKLAALNGGRRLKDPIWPGQYIRLR